jgi:hypothetical protein
MDVSQNALNLDPQLDPQVDMSYMTCAAFGSSRVSCKLSSRACGPRNPMKIVQSRAIISEGSERRD